METIGWIAATVVVVLAPFCIAGWLQNSLPNDDPPPPMPNRL